MSFIIKRILSLTLITIIFGLISYGHIINLIDSYNIYDVYHNEIYQTLFQGDLFIVEVLLLLYISILVFIDLVIILFNNSYHRLRLYFVFIIILIGIITGVVSYYSLEYRYSLVLNNQIHCFLVSNFLLVSIVQSTIRIVYKKQVRNQSD